MLVLGLTDGVTSGAAVIQDGGIVAAVHEERLCRMKMAYGFPRASIAEVLRIAGAAPGDFDAVAVAQVNSYLYDGVRPFDGWFDRSTGTIREVIFSSVGGLSPLLGSLPALQSVYYRARQPIFARRRQRIRRILGRECGIAAPVRFIDHHLAHAASAYFTSGFDDALVVTMDGGGDAASSHIYRARQSSLTRLGTTSAFDSLANFYAYVTHICGYKAHKHEGKITGLAAHGQPIYTELLSRLVSFENGKLRNRSGRVFLAAVRELERGLPKGWRPEDLAASIQKHCEDLAVAHVSHHLPKAGETDLAVAGGLFANVRINQKVAEIEGVRRLFVHPGMTDCGLAVGAALALCVDDPAGTAMQRQHDVIRDVYCGPEYSSSEIEAALQRSGLEYTRSAVIEGEIAGLLAQGHVVARFAGRMEYGPRALGNRSILYQPADPSVNDWLNKDLRRTEFMPFAPATLVEHAGDSYHNIERAADSARFMTVTYDCTDEMKRTCAGVVHVDGTARPQLVHRQASPSFHAIIEEFHRLTGVPTVINTSFNMHEEPIVCSPDDAIRAFSLGHLDFLAIGDFMVPSREPPRRAVRALAQLAVAD